MRADVKINDLWMFAMGWLREEIDFPTPQSQTNTVVVPGRNAPIPFYGGSWAGILPAPELFYYLVHVREPGEVQSDEGCPCQSLCRTAVSGDSQ